MITWKDIIKSVIVLVIIVLILCLGFYIFTNIIKFIFNLWLWAIMVLMWGVNIRGKINKWNIWVQKIDCQKN